MSDDLSGFSLLELFRMEAESHTATLLTGLVALEGASASPEVIEPLMRAAHSLKGAARIVGLDAAVRVAHAMEDGFVAAQKGQLVLQPEHVDILLRGVDMLVQIAQLAELDLESWQAVHAAEIGALVADLTAVKEGQIATGATREGEAPSEPGHGPTRAGAGLRTPPNRRPQVSRNRSSIPISRRPLFRRNPNALHPPLPTPHRPLPTLPHPPAASCGSPPRA